MTTIAQDIRKLTPRQQAIVFAVIVAFAVFLAALLYTLVSTQAAVIDFSAQVGQHVMSADGK